MSWRSPKRIYRADAVVVAIDLKERRAACQPIEDYGCRPPFTWSLRVRDEVITID